MKRTCFFSIILVCFFCFLISCDMFESSESDSVFSFADNTPDCSVVVVSFGGERTESRSSVYQVELDRDRSELLKESYVVELKHLKGEKECGYAWTFFSDDVKLYNVNSTGFTLPVSAFDRLGMYIVTAKSEVSSEFDKTFVVSCKSGLSEIVCNYSIQDSFINESLSYSPEMLSGTVNRFTKSINLVSGAVYNFTVCDASDKKTEIKDIEVNKTADIVSTMEFYDSSFQLVCKTLNNVSTNMTVSIPGTLVSLSVEINLIDITETVLQRVEKEEYKETILSFEKNSSKDADKSYTYKIETVSPLEDRILEFCLDFEIWDREAEEEAVMSPYYQAKVNNVEDIHWICNSVFYRTFEGDTLFKIEVDGKKGVFSIIPKQDTVYSHSELLQKKNLHCYVYVKYSEDAADTYREKYRIMIGGKLEKLELCLLEVDSGKEVPLKNDLSIKEGSETGWIFRVNYVPTTTEKRETLWYLSSSKEAKRYYSGDSFFYAPEPLTDAGTDKNRQKVLNMMQSANMPYLNLSSFMNDDGNAFIAYKYFLDNAEEGHSDLWTNYNSLALDVVLVAFNVEEKVYATVGIKDLNDKQITVKSVKGNAKSLVYNKITGYNNGDVQEYPNTIAPGYENERTFYMEVNEILKLGFWASFKITNLDVWGDSSAREILPVIGFDLDESALNGVIKMQTLYTLLNPSETNEEEKKKCLSEDGVIVYLKINNKYVVKLRIVIYESEYCG